LGANRPAQAFPGATHAVKPSGMPVKAFVHNGTAKPLHKSFQVEYNSAIFIK